MTLRILTDTASDIPDSTAEELGIGLIELNIHFGEAIDAVSNRSKRPRKRIAKERVFACPICWVGVWVEQRECVWVRTTGKLGLAP